jgi:hypothetical protein
MYPVPESTIPLFLKVLGTVLPGAQELFHLGLDMITLFDRYHVQYVIEYNEPALKPPRQTPGISRKTAYTSAKVY